MTAADSTTGQTLIFPESWIAPVFARLLIQRSRSGTGVNPIGAMSKLAEPTQRRSGELTVIV
jgi:hypothetical protein